MEIMMQDIPASDRFIVCGFSLSKKEISLLKEQVARNVNSSKRDATYHQFMDWEKKASEIVLYTYYANAGMNLPLQFDIVFDTDNPRNFQEANCIVNLSVWNGWVPYNEIAQGHKHILIAEFPEGIPSIFKSLYVFDGKEKSRSDKFQLGLCKKEDFEAIQFR